MDIRDALVFVPYPLGRGEIAVRVLREEIERRTGLRWEETSRWAEGRPLVLLALEELPPECLPLVGRCWDELEPPGEEGYRIAMVEEPSPFVAIVGNDERGLLYGVGKFLRKLHWGKGFVKLEAFSLSAAPRYRLRGHQLGYRPKTNAYDAWTPGQFEQYIRELALFGANSIEILPPRTDDAPTSPHMKVPPLEMMLKLSEIIDSYNLDVWIWYPNMGRDYRDPQCLEEERREREEIFSLLPRINAVFIPGGDPGHLPPELLFWWAGEVARILERHHPEAGVWLSPQSSQEGWIEEFLAILRETQPDWLGGIVFGPWVQIPLPRLRELVPLRYPLRHYPDITHSLQCQYPVWDWDVAFALTLGRECINPRPKAMKHIHNLLAPYTIGSISYSEGINDDVNKFLWSDQDWDPQTPFMETLRDYARLFICPQFAEGIAQGLLALEENWEGSLLTNERVDITLMQWQDMEGKVPREVLDNYRFQMGLLRAYYDAYIRRRLIYETELEREAREVLASSPARGSLFVLGRAEEILRRAEREPVAQDYKERCWELAEALFRNIGAQFSVTRHGAIDWSRGAFMDDIDMPLNNSRFLLSEFERIRNLGEEGERAQAILQLLRREDPGPGGFYDNFGTPSAWRRVIREKSWEEDPGNLSSPFISFVPSLFHQEPSSRDLEGIPLSWVANLTALYDIPISIFYDNLDPVSSYRIRITYIGEHGGEVKLLAGEHLVHDFLRIGGRKAVVVEYPIPSQAIKEGRLTLTWLHRKGRRTHIAEVWLVRE